MLYRARKNKGSILIDCVIAIFILGMGAVCYYGLLPVVMRSHQIASQESKAGQIATRVAEQYAMLKPSNINVDTLTKLNLIDTGQNAQPWTFTHLPIDDGTDYSPAKVLNNGVGQITTSNIANGSVLITITLTWNSPTGKARSLTTGAVVGGYR